MFYSITTMSYSHQYCYKVTQGIILLQSYRILKSHVHYKRCAAAGTFQDRATSAPRPYITKKMVALYECLKS